MLKYVGSCAKQTDVLSLPFLMPVAQPEPMYVHLGKHRTKAHQSTGRGELYPIHTLFLLDELSIGSE